MQSSILQHKSGKPALFTLLVLSLIVMAVIIAFPKECSKAMLDGLRLCAYNIIPSVFPFAVLSKIFISAGGAELLAKFLSLPCKKLFNLNGNCSAALILGLISGYPSGSVCAVSLYNSGKCNRNEAERLCAFCNNASPAFLVGGIGIGFLASEKLGYFLLIAQSISALLVGIILSKTKGSQMMQIEPTDSNLNSAETAENSIKISSLISDAVSESSFLMLKICGFAVFFQVLCSIFELFSHKVNSSATINSLVFGLSELGFAAEYVSQNLLNENFAAVLVSAFIGWSGLSVHMQVKSAVGDAFSLKPYFLGKTLQAILCAVIMFLLLLIK